MAVAKYFNILLENRTFIAFLNKHVFDVVHCLQLLKCLLHPECVHLTKRCVDLPIYFLRLSKVWSVSYHGSVGRGHKKCYLMLFFHYKICVFIIFISFFFFDEVSNFRSRILTNQKQELVVSNCQLNCVPDRFPKEHKISTFKAMTSEKLTCCTDKSIYNFLLLNQLSRPSIMFCHILNYQHMYVHLVWTHKVF